MAPCDAMKDYAAIATRYAQDVLDGRIPACKWVQLAAQRHMRDLARAGTAEFPYLWNPELKDTKGKTYRPADRACGFIELMPHIKGDWAARKELVRMEPWQVFCVASTFGWINQATLKRRFLKSDLYVPRKNAKSTVAAGIGNFMLAADGEHGAEVYSGATSRDQAHEVFRPAQLMAKMNAAFRSHYGVLANASNLAVIETNSRFEPLIGKPGDGASPSCAIVDEYHEHATSDLYDTMWTGMGARSQPLLLVITTAGNNIGGPAYTHQVELQKILQGITVDETRWGIIFGIDADDDWTDPAVLRKANPNFGISVSGEFLEAAQREAINDPRKQAIFKTKHLNVWVNSGSPWIDIAKLQACGDTKLREEDFRGDTCWIGTDLASKTDIATKAKVFRRRGDDGRVHTYLFTRNFLPQACVQRPENGHYKGWVAQSMLTQTPGNMIDLGFIADAIQADAELHVVAEIGMDAWGSREIAPQLQGDGFTVVDVPMTVRHLSEPMKEINALIEDGRFHHDGNLATVWMFSNVEVQPDRNDNIFPRKSSAEKKIDAAVACILAVGRAMSSAGSQDEQSWWEVEA